MPGGYLIEIAPQRVHGLDVLRLWVIDTNAGGPGVHDEMCVYAERQDVMPFVGEQIWWQGGKIYFGKNDCQHMRKVGFSFNAPCEQ